MEYIIAIPMNTQKQYISGHDIRRFFQVTEQDLQDIRRHHKDKIIDNGFYKWYDIAFLKSMFKIKSDVPPHLIVWML